jgi:hypothetical protein
MATTNVSRAGMSGRSWMASGAWMASRTWMSSRRMATAKTVFFLRVRRHGNSHQHRHQRQDEFRSIGRVHSRIPLFGRAVVRHAEAIFASIGGASNLAGGNTRCLVTNQ